VIIKWLGVGFEDAVGDLSTLSSLLGTDERNDSAQLRALRCLFSDNLLINSLGLGQIGGGLEHAVLEGEHLLEGVVEEWSAEADVLWTTGTESHLKLARLLF